MTLRVSFLSQGRRGRSGEPGLQGSLGLQVGKLFVFSSSLQNNCLFTRQRTAVHVELIFYVEKPSPFYADSSFQISPIPSLRSKVFLASVFIKQLAHSRLLDIRWLQTTQSYAPHWLFIISYLTSVRAIIVKCALDIFTGPPWVDRRARVPRTCGEKGEFILGML